MPCTSSTGLIPSINPQTKPAKSQITTFELPKFSSPAPYVLRPFAGVYNPFPYGCSVLCNHPADYEAKDVVRKAKETWATDGRALVSCDGFSHHRQSRADSRIAEDREPGDSVPEELFRKYTETDSRPITPAPTVASIVTRSSQARRCVTPDPISSQPCRERTLLVLDLRRSHSQETLNWVGATIPSTVLQPPTRTPSRSASSIGVTSPPRNKNKKPLKSRNSATRQELSTESVDGDAEASNKLKQQVLTNVKTLTISDPGEGGRTDRSAASGDEDVVKRRGRKKKGKKGGRDNNREGEKEFRGIPDPGETQVSALGESRGGSTRPSLTPGVAPEPEPATNTPSSPVSFLPPELLKQLQRQLEQEDVESEFDVRKRVRSQNFTLREERTMKELFIKYRDVLENKEITQDVCLKKKQTWQVIADEFNAIHGSPARTPNSIKHKFENFKRADRMRKSVVKVTPPKIEPQLLDQAVESIKAYTARNDAEMDCAALPAVVKIEAQSTSPHPEDNDARYWTDEGSHFSGPPVSADVNAIEDDWNPRSWASSAGYWGKGNANEPSRLEMMKIEHEKRLEFLERDLASKEKWREYKQRIAEAKDEREKKEHELRCQLLRFQLEQVGKLEKNCNGPQELK